MPVCKPGEETRLGFPHDFGIFANPDNQDELFPLGFLVIGVAHTSVSIGGLGVVQKSAQLVQAAGTLLGKKKFVGTFGLGCHKAKSARRGNSSGEMVKGKKNSCLIIEQQPIRF